MPELPEVECIRRGLEPALVGRRVERAELFRADYLTIEGPAARLRSRGKPAVRSVHAAARAMLQGACVAGVLRHGKQIAIVASRSPRAEPAGVLVVHLGMSGQILFVPPGRDAESKRTRTHVHATWRLDGGGTVLFRDPRRFGGLWALNSTAALDARWRSLGPDALTITPAALHAALRSTRRAVKAALLDQSVLAGVGNIYADEALFRAGIRPTRRADELNSAAADSLTNAIREVLAEAIVAGGTTLRDFRSISGDTGTYQTKKAVYARGGEPCLTCGRVLSSAVLFQRTTTWCESCQR